MALELLSRGVICVPLLPAGRHLDVAAMGYAPLHLRTFRKTLKELVFGAIAFELSQHPPDGETVRGWFTRRDHACGIVTGPGGLVALDFDEIGQFRDWRRRHKTLADAAPIQETPNGVHLFLRCRTPMVSSSLYHGFRKVGHLKALGGYITIALSRSANPEEPPYRWMPGRSLLECDLPSVDDLASLGLSPVSPFKRHYDRLLRRGFFESR